jgi:hypothetical protein
VLISPYLLHNRWYDEKKKKPALQLRILEEFTIFSRLSKSQVWKIEKKEHGYKETSEGIKNLRKNKLLEEDGEENGVGKPQKFYRITDDGLAALISENSDPEYFWSIVINYCLYCEKSIRPNLVDDLYEFFVKIYLKYSSGHACLVHLDEINDMCENWLQNNPAESICSRIIEMLGSKYPMTIDDLASKLNASIKDVEIALDDFMIGSAMGYLYPIDEYDIGFQTYERHLDMLQRCTIVHCNDAGENPKLKLSLIGIILYLTLIRKRYPIEKLIASCNRIAHYYKNRGILPLIFNKWPLIVNELGPFAAFNFEVIVNKKARKEITSLSVVMKGMKENYENMRSIILYNLNEMKNIESCAVYKMEYEEKWQNDNIAQIDRKLDEISLLTGYDDPGRIYNKLCDPRENLDQVVELLCNAYSEEITFMYYFALCEAYNILRITHNPDYSSLHQSLTHYIIKQQRKAQKAGARNAMTVHGERNLMMTSGEKLKQILKCDNELSGWFSTWLKDIYGFQRQGAEEMSKMKQILA